MMDGWVIWMLVGGVLIAGELLVGSPLFVLLILGVSAVLAGVMAVLGGALWAQLFIAAGGCICGYLLVRRYLRTHTDERPLELDAGEPVELVRQLSSTTAEVRYRGAIWQAEADGLELDWHAALMVKTLRGNTIIVGRAHPR